MAAPARISAQVAEPERSVGGSVGDAFIALRPVARGDDVLEPLLELPVEFCGLFRIGRAKAPMSVMPGSQGKRPRAGICGRIMTGIEPNTNQALLRATPYSRKNRNFRHHSADRNPGGSLKIRLC